jgi:hypothetical protein
LFAIENEGEMKDDNTSDDECDPTSTSSWEFVSQEEHPISGTPLYCLHPCRTGERMGYLMTTFDATSSSEVEEDESDRDGRSRSTKATTSSTIVPLLGWLSMVLPVVGCAIHPDVYRRMNDDIVVLLEGDAQGGG